MMMQRTGGNNCDSLTYIMPSYEESQVNVKANLIMLS